MLKYNRVLVGTICSNECKYCTHPVKQSRAFEEIQTDLVAGAGSHGAELYGGEPFARFDSSRLLSSASMLYRRVKVVTNGRALAKWDTLRAAMEAGVTGFEIKLWGVNQAVHDRLTGREGSFMDTIQGISNVRNFNASTYLALRVPVCKENLSQVADLSRAATTLRVDRVIFRPVDPELSLKEAAQIVKLAVETAITNRVWAMTEGLPLCVMGGYEPHVTETMLSGADEQKVSACATCVYDDVCGGVPKMFAAGFEGEAKPASESKYIEDLRTLRNETKAKSSAYNV